MRKIPYGRQSVNGSDVKAVASVLLSDWLTQGPQVEEFERRFADLCRSRYAVAVSSGTAALHLAYLAAGLGRGDEIITSPITFLATANAALYIGAKPVFADIDYDSVNISPDDIRGKIGNKTKALVPVHFAGYPCDMKEISLIAKRKKLTVIEDACHALGAEYKDGGKWRRAGDCRYSDMTVFSFHPVKHITTGEGGAVTTNSRKYYEKLKALRAHGIYKDASTAKKGQWCYEMRVLGFNYRITDFQCALGISQLKRADGFIKKRREIAKIYGEQLQGLGDLLELPCAAKDKKHVWHLYVVKINFEKLQIDRKQLFSKLNKAGIFPQAHYIPVYRQPYYRKNVCGKIFLKNAEKYYSGCLSLPIYPALTEKEQDYVIKTFRGIIIKNAKKK